ncbi:MAG: hypothetical protein ACI9KE_004371 [Polyangiales bacterium]
MPNLTNCARVWTSIFLRLGLAGCETTGGTPDASTTRRDTGPGPDSAALDTGGGGSDTGPAELVIDNSGMSANPFAWSDLDSENVSLCGIIEGNVLRLSEAGGAECDSGDPILIAQRSLTAVSFVARSSPSVEILSTTSASGSIVNSMRADGLFDTAMMDPPRTNGEIELSIASSDGGPNATVVIRCENFDADGLPAAFGFRFNGR